MAYFLPRVYKILPHLSLLLPFSMYFRLSLIN